MNTSNISWMSEESGNEIFWGPVTKKEIVSRLKYYNLLTKELLDPLNNYMDEDQLDENLILFYDDILFGKGNNSNCTGLDMSNIQDSLENIAIDNVDCALEDTENNTKTKPAICLESSIQKKCPKIIPKESCSNEENIKSKICNLTLNETEEEEIEESNVSITSYLSSASYEPSNSCVDNSTTLNDTLEEIELLMKYGVNYMNRDETVFSVTASHDTPSKNIENNDNNVINISDSINSNETKLPVQLKSSILSDHRVQSSLTCNIDNISHDCHISKECTLSSTLDTNLNNSNSRESNGECDENLKTSNRLGCSQVKTPDRLIQFNTPAVSGDTPALETLRSTYEKNKENKKTTNHNSAKLKTPDRCTKLKSSTFKNNFPFKVPSVTKVASSKKSPNLKSIVSPIAMYIKNSPTVPLVKNVVFKQLTCIVSGTNSQQSDGKSQGVQSIAKPSLPVRSYKTAARNIFVSKENEPAMPGNVRKLIKGPLNPEIIKHMGRVKDSPDRYPHAVPAIVQNNVDLTILSTSTASDGIFNVSTGPPGDISVLVSKNAVRTNSLQKPTT